MSEHVPRGRVTSDLTISADGYSAGLNQTEERPFGGDGGGGSGARLYLAGKLVDELHLHVAPLTLGGKPAPVRRRAVATALSRHDSAGRDHGHSTGRIGDLSRSTVSRPTELARSQFPDFRFAPNLGGRPAVYELENRAVQQAGHVLSAMRGLAPWAGRTIVDLGCGSGFWLPVYAADAARVAIGVEPDRLLLAAARRRTAETPRIETVAGSAEHIPLPDSSADVVHARFAYFFPPGTDA